SPSNMVVDGDLESGGVGDAFVRGGGGGFIIAVGGGSPPNMVVDGDFGSGGVGNVRALAHMDDGSPA
ncbi:hypothetical protein Tco_1425298, partial [Tanacetum coccineum]